MTDRLETRRHADDQEHSILKELATAGVQMLTRLVIPVRDPDSDQSALETTYSSPQKARSNENLRDTALERHVSRG
jgi:hypothetical protein